MNLTSPKVSTMFFDQIITVTDHNVTWEKSKIVFIIFMEKQHIIAG